jgi:hypothetical protein
MDTYVDTTRDHLQALWQMGSRRGLVSCSTFPPKATRGGALTLRSHLPIVYDVPGEPLLIPPERVEALQRVGYHPPLQELQAHLHRGLHGLQGWTETPYTFTHWRQYEALPIPTQLETLPPVPTDDPRYMAIMPVMRSLIRDAQSRLEAGDLRDARDRYGSLLRAIDTWRLQLLEEPPQSPRGRPKWSGADFRDEEDFFAKTFEAIHALDKEGVDPTRQNVACELMKKGVFRTSNIDTADTNLKRYCRRCHILFPDLVDRARRS